MTHQPGVYVPLRAIFLVTNLVFIFIKHYGSALAYWLERRTPDRETRVRSSAGSVCCFLEQETFTIQKYW